MTYDSGNVHLDKLVNLIVDLELDDSKYNTWETDFLMNLNEQRPSFEIGDRTLTDLQKEKIDELYGKHVGENS